MSVTTFSVTFPDELIEDAKEAAEMIDSDLNTFILQATFARVQELPAKLARKPITPADWPKERLAKDRAWINENYQELLEKYPDQWVYVHNQKVVGAHRRPAKAERQARVAIEDFHRDIPATIFVEGKNYVW